MVTGNVRVVNYYMTRVLLNTLGRIGSPESCLPWEEIPSCLQMYTKWKKYRQRKRIER